MRLFLLALSLFAGLLTACSTPKSRNSSSQKEVKDLQSLMLGSYLSKAQSERDTDYFNISLHMYPIWKSHKETWLYVEQAMAAKQDKPYRQRVYQLVKTSGDTFESKVFTLKNEKDAIGKWAQPTWFDQFIPEAILEERTGCEVILKRLNATTYEGSTKDKQCASTLRGASYANSIVRIEKKKIVSWDQGFDASDKQVWGATKGGYIFDKQ
jgi:CpeT protein